MRASLRRWSSEQFEDGLAHGWQRRLRRWAVDSFFSALLLRAADAGGRRTRSSSSAHDGAGLARIVPRSDRDRVLLSAVGEPARKIQRALIVAARVRRSVFAGRLAR